MRRRTHVRLLVMLAALLVPAAATFTDHAMQVPQLLFLKVANELLLETDLVFVRSK